MDVEQLHNNAKIYVINKINELSLPIGHPFLQTTNNTNGNMLEFLVVLKTLVPDNNIFDDLLRKCKSVNNGNFIPEIFNQNMSEINILYYILIGLLLLNNTKIHLDTLLYEGERILDNRKKLEFSFLMNESEKIKI